MRREPERTPVAPAAVRDMLDHARYYFPAERATAFDFLRAESPSVMLGELPPAAERSLYACRRAFAGCGIGVALIEVTAADIATTPFRVVRAVSPDLQPIAFGYGLERLPVARLAKLGVAPAKDSIAPIW
jgi:hypothetical protein